MSSTRTRSAKMKRIRTRTGKIDGDEREDEVVVERDVEERHEEKRVEHEQLEREQRAHQEQHGVRVERARSGRRCTASGRRASRWATGARAARTTTGGHGGAKGARARRSVARSRGRVERSAREPCRHRTVALVVHAPTGDGGCVLECNVGERGHLMSHDDSRRAQAQSLLDLIVTRHDV